MTETPHHQARTEDDEVVEEPQAKQPRLESATGEICYKVCMLGGSSVQVQVSPDGRAGDLYRRVRESGSLPFHFFSILSEGDRILEECDPLPAGGAALTVVGENPHELCEAAQKVIRESRATIQGQGSPALLERLRLGRCCELGTFDWGQWRNHIDEPEELDEDHIDVTDMKLCRYHVCELELIDGEDRKKKLVAVISQGSTRFEVPAFGPVYLRPEFKRVARMNADDEIASTWELLEDASSWYKDPVTPLPRSICISTGGREARTPLETHLAHALAVALSGTSICLGEIIFDGDDGWYALWDQGGPWEHSESSDEGK